MKNIVIHQENSDSILLQDDDSSNLNEYTKKISEILKSSNVCILETSSCSVVVRPSKINSVLISEFKEEITKEEQMDIIKD